MKMPMEPNLADQRSAPSILSCEEFRRSGFMLRQQRPSADARRPIHDLSRRAMNRAAAMTMPMTLQICRKRQQAE